jgi:hypothetical protein
VPRELAGEMGLIVEPDVGRDRRDRFPGQQSLAGGVDAPGHDVPVRRDRERLREAPDQVCR